MGDFNIHYDIVSDTEACNILTELGLKQHVIGPTHVSGHTLDLIITHDSHSGLSDIHVKKSIDRCDHSAVVCTVSLQKISQKPSDVKSRKWADVDPISLATFISGELSTNFVDGGDVTSNIALYNSVLSS